MSSTKINCIIHWIDFYPVDSPIHRLNNWGQNDIYKCYTDDFIDQATVVQKVDSTIHRMNHYPVDTY